MKVGDEIILTHEFAIKDVSDKSAVRMLTNDNHKAQIDLGGFIIQVNHTYTDEQIKHIKEYFGWEVTNYV